MKTLRFLACIVSNARKGYLISLAIAYEYSGIKFGSLTGGCVCRRSMKCVVVLRGGSCPGVLGRWGEAVSEMQGWGGTHRYLCELYCKMWGSVEDETDALYV